MEKYEGAGSFFFPCMEHLSSAMLAPLQLSADLPCAHAPLLALSLAQWLMHLCTGYFWGATHPTPVSSVNSLIRSLKNQRRKDLGAFDKPMRGEAAMRRQRAEERVERVRAAEQAELCELQRKTDVECERIRSQAKNLGFWNEEAAELPERFV